MRSRYKLPTYLIAMLAATLALASGVENGKAAPEFKLKDTAGNTHSLSDYEGKYVVLEWINYDCPFVRKHYNSGNMQRLQKTFTAKGVIWLAINSSAPGKQGNFSLKEILKRSADHQAAFSAYLMDQSGEVGRAYGAKTTPHMFVIDPDGNVIYQGGIDDTPSTKVKDIEKAQNYVAAALDAALTGKTVEITRSKPYGCSVKY